MSKIARGNYASLDMLSIEILHKSRKIDRLLVNSDQYWQALYELGELLLKKDAQLILEQDYENGVISAELKNELLAENQENKLVFTENDMIKGYF